MLDWARKALGSMRHVGRAPMMLGFLARTRFDYAKEVGTGIDSSVVTAPVQWIQRAFPEARFRVMRGRGDESQEILDHALADLIARPNPFYGSQHLWAATIFSWCVAGNAYWFKIRNGAGRVSELWWVAPWLVAPKWPADGSAFITHYEYKPGGGAPPVDLDPDDVVHFRHGIDPGNPRLGLSPLHGTLREIFMDLESSNFVASLLRNLGVPGVVISPDGGAAADPEDVEAVKTWFRESFGGDRRGAPLVMGGATKVQEYGFDPQKMDLSTARDVAEERVCASLGIPAAVVGFGAGLQTAKVGATMGELRKLAWTNGVMPLQRSLADELDRSLLPDFETGRGSRRQPLRTEFDASEVIALEEDLLKRAQRWNEMIRGGWAEVAEGRDALGLDVDDSHRVFLRPFSAIEVPAGAVPTCPTMDPGEGTQRRSLPMPGAKQRRASAAAFRRGAAHVRALDAMADGLAEAFQTRLAPFFGGLGQTARDAALLLLEAQGEAAGADPGAVKVNLPSGEDQVLAGLIAEQLELPLRQADFRRLYEAHYLTVAEEVAKVGDLIGLATDLPDPVARAVVAAGGRRAGLVDLESQSRQALFDALAEGRAAGEGVGQLAARIADQVGGGPWRTPEQRARTIARTETKYAQNVSTVARARHEGVDEFIVFDGRFGPGRSTPSHIARDGIVVSAQAADRMAAEEHPNGTLSFSPFFGEESDDEA